MQRDPSSEEAAQEIRALLAKAEMFAEEGRFVRAFDTLHECDLWTPFVTDEEEVGSELISMDDELESFQKDPCARKIGDDFFTVTFRYADDSCEVAIAKLPTCSTDSIDPMVTLGLSPDQADDFRSALVQMEWEPLSELSRVETERLKEKKPVLELNVSFRRVELRIGGASVKFEGIQHANEARRGVVPRSISTWIRTYAPEFQGALVRASSDTGTVDLGVLW